MLADGPNRMDDGSHPLHLSPIMTTTSTPATPGPSTPTTVRVILEHSKSDGLEDMDENIVPPARPKSTPFPEQDMVEGDIQCSQRFSDRDQEHNYTAHIPLATQSEHPGLTLTDLPTEIHDGILDHLFGVRSSASSRTAVAGNSKVLRAWGSALRHSRRREVSELALVCKKWRPLVQDRLYRHLKIKGTRDSVNQASQWFSDHPHLCNYVKHIEIWFPVFQQKNPAFDRTLRIPSTTPDRSIQSLANRSHANLVETGNSMTYQTPANNCSLEEVFRFISMTFAEACVLTLEGGDRKKPPQVQHFQSQTKELPALPYIRTLVCKSQWNLIRSDEDFQNISAALPNLGEWHASYAKPKSKSYISMAAILPNMPQNLTHLSLCLEADYRREAVSPTFFQKVGKQTHFCAGLAKALPTLEHLSYTGRVCHVFFDNAAKLCNSRESRLKSIDLVVKNCCRAPFVWSDGSGITDMGFIQAFESLVLSSIKSLDKLAALEFLRIRFLDLESQVPALNPYFQLAKTDCTGIWSEAIINALAKARPAARFVEKPEALDDIGFKDGQLLTTPTFSKTKPLTIKISSYQTLSGGITIN